MGKLDEYYKSLDNPGSKIPEKQPFGTDVDRLGSKLVNNPAERMALNWLLSRKGIPIVDLVKTNGDGRPDFIHHSTKGDYGYEVKALKSGYIAFSSRQYEPLRTSVGDVLVFDGESDSPNYIIPFNSLPCISGDMSINGIKIRITKDKKTYYSTMAIDEALKPELETIRGMIEGATAQQHGWGDMVSQALYAVLCDLKLTQFCNAERFGVTFFMAKCPYCQTDNDLKLGNDILYWYHECKFCKRKFVAKRVWK